MMKIFESEDEKHAVIGLLESIAADFSHVGNIDEIGAMVESAVERVLDVSFAGIYLFDKQIGRLRLLFARGFTEEERVDAECAAMDSHPGEVFRTGKILYIPDIDKEPGKSTTSDRSFVVGSRLYLPVLSRETCVGCFGLASSVPHAFSDDHIQLLRFVGNMATVIYKNLQATEHAAQLNQELAESERSLRVLFEHTPSISVQGYNSRREVFFWNRASEEFYGYTAQEAIGRKLEDLIIPDAMREGVIEAVTAWVDGGPAIPAGPLVLKRADGSDIPIFSSHMMTHNARGEAEMYCIDISLVEQRRLEAKLKAARQAEEANRAKSEFLANMSHELRTPLSAILGLSEGLLEQTRGPLNERQQSSLRTVQSSGQHLLGLINEILDLARIEAGQLGVIREWTPVRESCEAALALVREQAVAKGIALELHLGDSEAHLEVDPRRLKQILVNLLSNAVKFTPEGGRVELATASAGNEVFAFTVTDTGIGIAQEDQVRLFQPFVQIDAGLARRHDGTGLGLSLVQRLADLLGGGVTLESEPGKGSRFTVTLPVGTQTGKPASEDGTALVRPPQPIVPGSRGLILLVEDNEWNIQTVVDYLEARGFEVEVARDGVEALVMAKARPPDLVLMDIQMPRLDGIETTKRLRSELSIQMPIVALTALAMPGDEERCREAGTNAYLSKPVRMKELIKTIDTLLTGS